MFYNKTRAQVSVEFLIIFAILFFLFVGGIYIASQKNSEVNEQEKIINSQIIGISLGNIINQVYLANNGFQKIFFLKGNVDYNIEISNYRLYIVDNQSKGYFDYPIYTNDVIINATEFNLIKISKENNNVVITDAE